METQAGWVLVVDDDQGTHALYRSVLGGLGFAIEICDSSA
jgi:hypothetical protein